jgi:hypothetical protein
MNYRDYLYYDILGQILVNKTEAKNGKECIIELKSKL